MIDCYQDEIRLHDETQIQKHNGFHLQGVLFLLVLEQNLLFLLPSPCTREGAVPLMVEFAS